MYELNLVDLFKNGQVRNMTELILTIYYSTVMLFTYSRIPWKYLFYYFQCFIQLSVI